MRANWCAFQIFLYKSDIRELHGFPSAEALVRAIKKLSAETYGYAGREFLRYLTEPSTLERVRKNIETDLDEIVDILCEPTADGQVKRVARRFALVVVAGKLAIEFGILPADIYPISAVKACFLAWLMARGGSGPMEDMQILSQFRLFIEGHGSDQFRDEGRVAISKDNLLSVAPITRDMVGFRKTDPDGTYSYFILPESFKKIMAGHREQRALKVLYENGWLIKQDTKRYKSRFTFPGYKHVEVYHFKMPANENN